MTKLAPDPLFGMSSPQPREITLTLQEPGASALVVARSRSPNTSPEPTALSDGKESLSFSYLGALLASTTSAGTVSGKVSYTYDARLRVKTESVNDTSVISYGYDTDNTLLSATVDGVVLEHKRNNKGQVASSTLSKGNTVLTTTSYTYDAAFGELSSIQVERNGTPLFSYTIEQRDNLGREKIRLEATATGVVRKSFEYDAAGRLSKSKTCSDTDTLCAFPVQTQTMSYDDNGNFVDQLVDDQDRLTSASGISYDYNAEGWRTGKKVSVLASSFSYHPLGHLLSIKGDNGTAAYTVDPLGRRIVAKEAIANTPFERRFLYRDSLRPAAELDASNSLRSRFVYTSGRNVPDFFLLNGTPFLLVTDPRGSVRLVVNAETGTVEQEMEYDAWGKVTKDTAAGKQPFGFAGGMYDGGVGLVHFGAREYDPEARRWLQKDPAGFGGGDSNLYAYVGGDPVNYIDPEGRWLLPVAGVLIGGAAQAWTNYEAYSCGRISGSQFAASIAIGGAVGGLATIPTGIIGGAVAGGLGSALNEMVNADIGAKKQDLGELVKAIGVGALAGGFANYLGIAGSKFLVTEKVIGKTIPLAPVKTQAELGGAIGTALGTAWATF